MCCSKRCAPRARPHVRARTGEGPVGEIVIVPDRHGSGTNGLLLTPPDALCPSFGPDSRARHERDGERGRGATGWRIERPASLLLDIDTGEDLAVLQERLPASASAHHGHAR